ncbi:MAG: hypothetical protein AAFW65_09710 [Pseudomonadota bacterium]
MIPVTRIIAGFSLILVSACTSAATAQENAPTPTPIPANCEGEAYRAFDFWLGSWTVTDPAGTEQGLNTITAEENGCLLVERWTSATGSTGQSYNYYDPARETWRQVWVSTGGVIDYEGGLTDTGSMKLIGEIVNRNGTSAPFTGEWTPNEDGTVTQHFEQQDTETGEWSVWFTGIYTRLEVDSGE